MYIYIYICVAIIRSHLGMQLPLDTARACAIAAVYICVRIYTYMQLADGDAQERTAHRNQRRQKAEAKTGRTRRGQKVGVINDAEGCSTLAALLGKH